MPAVPGGARPAARRPRHAVALGLLTASAILAGPAAPASAAPITGVDLSRYERVGRHDLPTPANTPGTPAGSLLAREASGVSYDRGTDSLFVVGDGATAIVRVSKTGALLDSMAVQNGTTTGGPGFYDTEGIATLGGGRLLLPEERDRQVSRLTYRPGTTLTRSDVETVKLGTTVGNVGIEGITTDGTTGDVIAVKEKDPLGLFRTSIDFAAGTASNGSASTTNSANLFDPSLVGTSDLSDVFALSNVAGLTGPESSRLLVISQEAGRVVNVGRDGTVSSSLTIRRDDDNALSVPDQTFEGATLDDDGTLYLVSEGGGGADRPQLWVYRPTDRVNAAPTAVATANAVATLPEDTRTTSRVKLADVGVTDDGLGTNDLAVTGPDAAAFEVDRDGLYLRAGTALDFETKRSYAVSVTVDDRTVGATPDATSTAYALAIGDVAEGGPSGDRSIAVTEVAPWGSGNATYEADWFEVTNTGTAPVDLTGWKVDDDSNAATTAVPLAGVGVVAPGRSAVLVNGTASAAERLVAAWYGTTPPDGLRVGTYTGGGIGLSTGGDQVNLFTPQGEPVGGVRFGASTTGVSFDNSAAVTGTTAPPPAITTLSAAGRDGAFVAGSETGSPGLAPQPVVSEVAPWGNGNATYRADWFELTNRGTAPLDLTGFRMDDGSNAFASAVALDGVATLGPGRSAVFVEGDAATAAAFGTAWFGTAVPADALVGTYAGSGVGLGDGGDAVNVFDAAGLRRTGVAFGAATKGVSFDNAVGVGSTTVPTPAISALSVAGRNGAFAAGGETGSPLSVRTPEPPGTGTPAPGSGTPGPTVPATPAPVLVPVPSTPVTTAPPARPVPPRATVALARSARASSLARGLKARLRGLRGASPIVVTIRRGRTTLRTTRSTAGRSGRRTVAVRLTRRQLATLRGRSVAVRIAVTGADGRPRTLVTRIRVR